MIGIDEVGRGCWAGPLLVVAARAHAKLPDGMTDSKLITGKRRAELLPLIQQVCDIGEGWVASSEIDQHGLAGAMRLGVHRALTALNAQSTDKILLDGNVNYADASFTSVECIVGGDKTVGIISAASIVAKELRDDYMCKIDAQFPHYGFASHVGYGTASHKQALSNHGICNEHRTSYKPIAALL